MSKKFLWTLLICLVLFVVGVYLFSHLRRTPPPNTNPASNWPATPPSPATSAHAPAGRNPKEPPASAAEANRESVPAEPGFTLRPGETLEYDANVTKLNSTVANLKIVAAEKRNLGGKGSWHLQAFAHTENPYRMVFELDDEFDSYSDAGSMTSLQYEMHLNERGQKVDNVERLLPSPGDPPPPGTSAARVLPGTRDPLGMLEYLRGVDWNHVAEVHGPVYDGRKLYSARAVRLGKSAGVTVPAGKYNTIKIEIHVMDNGAEMKDAHFVLYLTDDAARLPVLMEAILPVATARVELTKTK
jgi:Protein of unknown function (DUF3108)